MTGLQYDGVVVQDAMKTERALEIRGERRFHWQSALLMESVRRQTFTNWTIPYIDVDQLASAGFFSLRTNDHVQCVFCQGVVGYWDPGDNPELEHCKHFPRCAFMTGVATGNVPMVTTDTQDPTSQLYSLLNRYHSFKVASTRPHNPTPPTPYQTDATRVGGTTGHIAFPHLTTPSSRLATYTRWPKDVGVSAESLAEAGFFSTGLADWVQCFTCGGGLHSWRRGDIPLEDHAYFYPFCSFVRVHRGENAGEPNVRDTNLPTNPPRPLTLTQSEANLLLHHPLAQRLVGMGLSSVSVREALRSRLEERGVLCRTVTDALELVFDYEEDQRKKMAGLCNDGVQFQQVESEIGTSEPQGHMDTTQNIYTNSSIQEKQTLDNSNDEAKLRREVTALRQQVEIEEKRLLCRMCGEKRVAVVFQPCSHLHLCSECARPRDTCSTCNSIVRGTLRPIIG